MAIKGIRARLSYLLASSGKSSEVFTIDEIPKEYSNFMDTKDKWAKVLFPKGDDVTSCVYVAKKGVIFPAHFHKSTEHCCILNPKGKVRYYTKDKNDIISFPNGFNFESGEAHVVEFLEDTKILIMWHPEFKKGWEANFIEKNEEE